MTVQRELTIGELEIAETTDTEGLHSKKVRHLPNEVRCTIYPASMNFIDMKTGEVIAKSLEDLDRDFPMYYEDIKSGRTTFTVEERK